MDNENDRCSEAKPSEIMGVTFGDQSGPNGAAPDFIKKAAAQSDSFIFHGPRLGFRIGGKSPEEYKATSRGKENGARNR